MRTRSYWLLPHRPPSLAFALFLAFACPTAAWPDEAVEAARHASGDCTQAVPVETAGSDTARRPCTDATAAPALMLAEVYSPGIDVAAYWVSEKLDGVRAYWDGGQLISRGGTRLKAPHWFTAGFPAVALDGELWMGRSTFDTLSGTVRREEPDEAAWRRVRYMVFDMPEGGATFGQRLSRLRALIATLDSPYLTLVEQSRVADHAALTARLDAVVAAGGEGLMLHRDDAPYRATRSDDLLKLKPYMDAEARVVAHLPGKGKYAGMLGALEVETAEGTRFAIGTGFTDAQRSSPPPIGTLVTYKYHGLTARGVPRFASFLRVREEP